MKREKRIPMRCRKHGTKYDGWDEQCPQCLADVSAFEYVIKRLTCQLCGEIKASVTLYAGGPIGQMCDDCHEIIGKWEDAKKAYDAYMKERRFETDSQIFFRSTFDNDPVQYIWG